MRKNVHMKMKCDRSRKGNIAVQQSYEVWINIKIKGQHFKTTYLKLTYIEFVRLLPVILGKEIREKVSFT